MIFALDLAITTGFAFGPPDADRPTSGSIRFASEGASHEAVFAAAVTWAEANFRSVKPAIIVWEAPLPTVFKFAGGGTNIDTTSLLFGLPAVIGAVAYLMGFYDTRKVRTADVRRHFIGENPKGKGKQLTKQKCRSLGWSPVDDNEADACAIWSYMAALVDPKQAIRVSPLFRVAR